jgi:RNA polymerase sigma factor (TIGR02999 family)
MLAGLRLGSDPAAMGELFAVVYDELRALAKRQRRAWDGNETIGTTALVHEAYLKLAEQSQVLAVSRAQFFALAAHVMRHILSNYARDRSAKKRGGGAPVLQLDEVLDLAPDGLTAERTDILVALDEALTRLEALNSRQGRIVECRFYAGMSIPDTAAALDISPATVKRDWALAQVWLYRELRTS